MKIKQKNSSKKIILIVAASALLLGSTGAAWYTLVRNKDSQSTEDKAINYERPTDEEITAGNDTKKNSIEQPRDTTAKDSGTKNPPNTNPSKSTTSMEITSFNQDESTLYIRTLIHAVTASGSCSLSMNGPGGATYSEEVSVQALPNGSTCTGFNIPTTKLTSGKWQVTVSFSNDNQIAKVTKDITVK